MLADCKCYKVESDTHASRSLLMQHIILLCRYVHDYYSLQYKVNLSTHAQSQPPAYTATLSESSRGMGGLLVSSCSGGYKVRNICYTV